MKSADLVVGTDYAYKERKWRDAQRVTVLETGATKKVPHYYGTRVIWEDKKGFVRVKFCETGREDVVRPQTIERLWSEHAKAQQDRADYERKEAQRQAATAKHRAEVAYALHQHLKAKGAPEKPVYVSNWDGKVAVLARAGFEETKIDVNQHFLSTVPDLDKVMEKGLIPLAAVEILLHEIEEDQRV